MGVLYTTTNTDIIMIKHLERSWCKITQFLPTCEHLPFGYRDQLQCFRALACVLVIKTHLCNANKRNLHLTS
jgi:hypothetical protein